MIKARLDYDDKTITNVDMYFNRYYKPERITHPLVKDIIKDIDKSEVIYEGEIKSPFLGYTTPEKLSRGTKALLLMLFEPDNEYDASQCGDNCAIWIYKISKINNINLSFRSYDGFS